MRYFLLISLSLISFEIFSQEYTLSDSLRGNLSKKRTCYDVFFYDLNIIIDRTLERFQIVYAAAGHPNSIFKIDISKLKDLTKGRVEDITEWDSLL